MRNEPRHHLDEGFDGEGLAQHRRRSEPIGLFGRLFVPSTYEDRRGRKALLDSTHRRACAGALISMEIDKVSDDKLGSRVARDIVQPVDQQQLVALIAQHLAEEVSSGGVVLDDQDLWYSPHAGGFAPGPQF
jgi:hypothetical protein